MSFRYFLCGRRSLEDEDSLNSDGIQENSDKGNSSPDSVQRYNYEDSSSSGDIRRCSPVLGWFTNKLASTKHGSISGINRSCLSLKRIRNLCPISKRASTPTQNASLNNIKQNNGIKITETGDQITFEIPMNKVKFRDIMNVIKEISVAKNKKLGYLSFDRDLLRLGWLSESEKESIDRAKKELGYIFKRDYEIELNLDDMTQEGLIKNYEVLKGITIMKTDIGPMLEIETDQVKFSDIIKAIEGIQAGDKDELLLKMEYKNIAILEWGWFSDESTRQILKDISQKEYPEGDFNPRDMTKNSILTGHTEAIERQEKTTKVPNGVKIKETDLGQILVVEVDQVELHDIIEAIEFSKAEDLSELYLKSLNGNTAEFLWTMASNDRAKKILKGISKKDSKYINFSTKDMSKKGILDSYYHATNTSSRRDEG